MKEIVEPIYHLKTSVFLAEEDAWEAFTKWRGYESNSRYFIIKTKEWWDVYKIF